MIYYSLFIILIVEMVVFWKFFTASKWKKLIFIYLKSLLKYIRGNRSEVECEAVEKRINVPIVGRLFFFVMVPILMHYINFLKENTVG